VNRAAALGRDVTRTRVRATGGDRENLGNGDVFDACRAEMGV
jgi:hypothetical protein